MSSPPAVLRQHRTPDGTTIAYRTIEGRGPTLVALHGFTLDGRSMEPLIRACRGDRPAVLVDVVGHGRSDSPPELIAYQMPQVVDQVLSVVAHAAGPQVHLVGYSMGGRIVLSMAARAPWFFSSITTISATAGIEDPTERAARYDVDQRRAEHIERVGVRAFIDEWLEEPIFAPLVDALEPGELEVLRESRYGNDEHGLAQSVRGTGTGSMAPVWDALPGIRSPLLAIAGALDDTYVRHAAALAAATPSGVTWIAPDAGHALPLEIPQSVATRVAEFLEECERTATEADGEARSTM